MATHSMLNIITLARTAKDSTSFDPSMLYLILALVALFVLVLLLVFLRNRMFPLIRLGIIRLRYGLYSYEYIEFFKNNDLRNPLNNCIKDEVTLRFLPFFKSVRNLVVHQTRVPVEFGDTPFLTPYARLMKAKGEPDCINVAKFIHSRVKVIGYNEQQLGFRMKSLYYFIDDKFVMGEYLFSDFIRSKPVKIKEMILSKYHNGVTEESDTLLFKDERGNALFYENNGFTVCLRYFFTGDSSINETLAMVYAGEEGKSDQYSKTLQHEEMLNRF